MKIIRMLIRGIRDALKSVFRNFSLSFASVSCISITLIVIACSLLISYNVRNITTSIEQDVTVVVFIDKGATDVDLEQIDAQLRSIKNIESITLKTKEQEKEEFMKESEVFKNIMADWKSEESPLKDSFMVKVVDIKEIGKTVDEIKKIDKVFMVQYGEGTVEKMVSVFSVIERVTIAIVIALIFVNVFLIINTIKLAIFARKREISIMRLVGASNFSINI